MLEYNTTGGRSATILFGHMPVLTRHEALSYVPYGEYMPFRDCASFGALLDLSGTVSRDNGLVLGAHGGTLRDIHFVHKSVPKWPTLILSIFRIVPDLI